MMRGGVSPWASRACCCCSVNSMLMAHLPVKYCSREPEEPTCTSRAKAMAADDELPCLLRLRVPTSPGILTSPYHLRRSRRSVPPTQGASHGALSLPTLRHAREPRPSPFPGLAADRRGRRGAALRRRIAARP